MTLDMKESNVLGSETERDLKGQGETLPNELPPYVLVRDPNPYAAVGRAAGMLQPFRNFALMPFGQVNALIIGAVNRGHYHYLLKDGQPAGFFAWAFASQEAAELWLEKKDPSLIGDGKTGDCVVFNIWHIDKSLHGDFDLQAFLIRSFRDLFADKKELLARRVYPDGRVKPIRIKGRKLQI